MASKTSHFYINESLENEKSSGPSSVSASNHSTITGSIAKTITMDSIHSSPLVTYAFRLGPGDELRKSLLHVVKDKNMQAAFVLTCVGSASSAKLRLARASAGDTNYVLDVMGPVEIISLTGTLSGGAGHLHASVADEKGKVVGGHLLEMVVATTAEVVLGDCPALSFFRDHDAKTGFSELLVFPR